MAAHSAGPGGSFESQDKLTSNTLKRHPKMELNKNDLLRLLSYLEGELQAREIVIAALKTDKAKRLLYQAKYGRFGLADPFCALQRDSDDCKDFDESGMKNMYDNQLNQLENLIATQRQAVAKMKEQIQAVDKRYHKMTGELDDEKRKHAKDMAQGDDVTYALEKEREQLKKEVEFERSQNKKLEKELKKVTASLEEERKTSIKHKQVAIMLIKERRTLAEKLILTHRRCKELEILVTDDHRGKQMAESVAKDSQKSLEKSKSDFDGDQDHLKARLKGEELRNLELSSEIDHLRDQLYALQKHVLEKRGDGPFKSIEIKSSVSNKSANSSPNQSVDRDTSPQRSPSPQIRPPVTSQTKVYKTTPPNTPPETRRMQVDCTADMFTKHDSTVKRAILQLQNSKQTDSSSNEVVLTPGSRVTINPNQPGSPTVFTTPSGGKISFRVGSSGDARKPSTGRGTPPPIPPNKPVLNPNLAAKKDNSVRVGAASGSSSPVNFSIGKTIGGQKFGIMVGKEKVAVQSPESEGARSIPINVQSPPKQDGPRKVSQVCVNNH